MNTATLPEKQAQALERIKPIRLKIDARDEIIAKLLAERNRDVVQIGEIKREAGLKVLDENRENEQFARYESWAKLWNVTPEQIIEPFRTIVRLSKIAQKWGSLAQLRERKIFKGKARE